MGRFGRLALAGAVSLVAGSTLMIGGLASGASASGCSNSWIHSGSGLWADHGNWSKNAVPVSTDDVCIGDTVSGSYTVTLNGSGQANSITVGGTLTGTQTLAVQGTTASGSAVLSLGTGANTIKANGQLLLDSNAAGSFGMLSGGTVTNDGLIQTVQDAGNIRYIRSNLTNDIGGTIDIAAASSLADQSPSITNNGTFRVDPGGGYAQSGGTFTNSAGGLVDNGSFSAVNLTFIQSGTTISGSAVPVLVNDGLTDSAGIGKLNLEGGNTLAGTIPSGQTIVVLGTSTQGSGTTSLSGTVTDNGSLNLDSNFSGAFSLLQPATGGALTVNGVMKTIQDQGNVRYVRVSTTVANGGTMEVASASTLQDSSTNMTISAGAAFKVDSGASYAASGGTWSDNGGTLTDKGTLSIVNGTLNQAGTTVTGTASPVVVNETVNDSAGTGTLSLEGSNSLAGTIPTGQTIVVLGTLAQGSAQTSLSGTVIDNGTLTLDSTDSGAYSLVGPTTGTLTVNGILSTIQDQGNFRYVRANVVVPTGGAVHISSTPTNQDQSTNTTISTGASFTIDAGASYAAVGGTWADNGGTLTDNGSLSIANGTLNQAGTTVTGTASPVVVNDAVNDSAGTGTLDLEGSNTLSGTIPTGQTLVVLGTSAHGSSTTSLSTVTNNGTLTMDSNDPGAYSLLSGSPLVNNGTFNTLQDAGNIRYVRVSVTNGGTMNLGAANNQMDSGTTVTNNGTLNLGDAAGLTLSGTTISDASGSTTGATIDATTGSSSITGGTVQLAGTLSVSTVGSPPSGNTYHPISSTALSGTFSKLAFPNGEYAVSYSASALTLVAGIPFTLTGKNLVASEDVPARNVQTAMIADATGGESYTASINWGDSATSAGTVSGNVVKGTHTYESGGSFTVTTTVTDADGTIRVVTSTATVSAAPTPTVTLVAPSAVGRSGSATLTLTGTGFTDDGTVTFSAAGITVTHVTHTSATSMTVKVNVSATATLGLGNVSVTTDGGTGTCTGCLTVDAAPNPQTATGPLPNGQTTLVTVTGTGFQVGLTVTTSIPGATVGTISNVTSTSFQVQITVPLGTTPATYRLTVINPDGGRGSRLILQTS